MARMTSHRRIRRHAATEAAPQRNEDRTRKLLATLADQSLVAAVPVAEWPSLRASSPTGT